MQFRGGMSELMRQASRLQRRIEIRKKELAEEKIEATSAGDKVKVTVSCNQDLVAVKIDPEFAKSEDLSMLEDAIVAAANQALTKAREYVDAELEKVTGGMKIPGMT